MSNITSMIGIHSTTSLRSHHEATTPHAYGAGVCMGGHQIKTSAASSCVVESASVACLRRLARCSLSWRACASRAVVVRARASAREAVSCALAVRSSAAVRASPGAPAAVPVGSAASSAARFAAARPFLRRLSLSVLSVSATRLSDSSAVRASASCLRLASAAAVEPERLPAAEGGRAEAASAVRTASRYTSNSRTRASSCVARALAVSASSCASNNAGPPFVMK
eukprot:CAMPEP_0179858802 /NCGR_PEP_ID=MMETSP0982-20121206/12645_1 /TAXON_ID=483367 /ORGANISM="non described non described, Strain CCMP 2436" /LENGTH=224 /DNA_ID=CAMNT_0021745747 /DNA_START=493 /DNA_END=1168 /DNA_ORIENTATION=+